MLKKDTESFWCDFPGCRFSHNITKECTRAIMNNFQMSKSSQIYWPKEKSNDEGKIKEQSVVNYFSLEPKRTCVNMKSVCNEIPSEANNASNIMSEYIACDNVEEVEIDLEAEKEVVML